MREVLEDHISPADLSKKYNISAHSIRDWVKKAGHQLPKSYKRFPYAAICRLASIGSAFLPLSKYAFISFACMPHICIPLCMNVSLSLNLSDFHVYFSEMYFLQHNTFIYSSARHIRISCAMLTLPTCLFVLGWKRRKASEQRPDLLLLVLLFSTLKSYAPCC